MICYWKKHRLSNWIRFFRDGLAIFVLSISNYLLLNFSEILSYLFWTIYWSWQYCIVLPVLFIICCLLLIQEVKGREDCGWVLQVWHYLLLKLLHQQIVTLIYCQGWTCLFLCFHFLRPSWPVLFELQNWPDEPRNQDSHQQKNDSNRNELIYHAVCFSDIRPHKEKTNYNCSNFVKKGPFPMSEDINLLDGYK